MPIEELLRVLSREEKLAELSHDELRILREKIDRIAMSAPQARTHRELKSRSIFLSSLFLSPTPLPIEIGRVHKAELDYSFRMPRQCCDCSGVIVSPARIWFKPTYFPQINSDDSSVISRQESDLAKIGRDIGT